MINIQRMEFRLKKAWKKIGTPFVGTGLEARVTYDSGAVARIERSGYVLYVDSQRIEILTQAPVASNVNEMSLERQTVHLTTYQRSNQDTCMHQRPSVLPNTWVHAGECLADTASTVAGELALGKNILVAYMPWEGYNFAQLRTALRVEILSGSDLLV